jgi:6,7-dimethyl-8-ribityllumazine synthase
MSAPPRPERVAIVVSRYNWSITGELLEGAIEAYRERRGEDAEDPEVIEAPGSYELPALALAAAARGYQGIVALGCIVKGETIHDEVIAHAVAKGLMDVTMTMGVPVALGVLTVKTPKQAKDRAGGKFGNKGHEAMTALLDTMQAADAITDADEEPDVEQFVMNERPDKVATRGGKKTTVRGAKRGGR